ncbi:MAG: hypothetical protein P1U56_23070 [Saprospiraceae bacterium]|nr:hypothetical protein [Saprospiraceae bacterium]
MIKNEFKPIKKKSKKSIYAIVEAIHSKVSLSEEKFTLLGLRDGYLGLSLFKFHLAEYTNDASLTEEANTLIERAFDDLNNEYVSGTLYAELLELGWYLEYCRRKKWIDTDVNAILTDIDSLLFDLMDDEKEKLNYDPITGVLGYAFYVFSRIDAQPSYVQKIEEVVEFIFSIKVENEDNSCHWISKLKEKDQVYLGITHGSAAIILFLRKAFDFIQSEELKKEITHTIEKACRYIKNSEYDSHYLVFPIVKEELKYSSTYSKNYCYGDFSTIYSLYLGYQFLGDKEGMEYAKTCLLSAHARGYEKPFLDSGKSLLYGHAGLAMLLRSLYKQSNEDEILPIYNDRIDFLINSFDPCDEFLGYKGYWNQSLEHTNYSFFEGLIGIGIELLASIDKKQAFMYEEFFFLES